MHRRDGVRRGSRHSSSRCRSHGRARRARRRRRFSVAPSSTRSSAPTIRRKRTRSTCRPAMLPSAGGVSCSRSIRRHAGASWSRNTGPPPSIRLRHRRHRTTRGTARTSVSAAAAQAMTPTSAADSRSIRNGCTWPACRAACGWRWPSPSPNNIAGVIASSAGYPDSQPRAKVPFAVFGTAGTEDFNYLEMRLLDRKLSSPHFLAVFQGGHTLPPDDVAFDALEWMELQAMQSGRRNRDDALVGRILEKRPRQNRDDDETPRKPCICSAHSYPISKGSSTCRPKHVDWTSCPVSQPSRRRSSVNGTQTMPKGA